GHHRVARLRALQESVEHRARHRRLLGWSGRCSGLGHAPCRQRQRRWRLHPHPGRHVRARRPQALPGPRVDGARERGMGPLRPARGVPHHAGLRRDPRRHRHPVPRRRRRRTRPRPPVGRPDGPRSRQPPHRLHGPQPPHRSPPRLRRCDPTHRRDARGPRAPRRRRPSAGARADRRAGLGLRRQLGSRGRAEPRTPRWPTGPRGHRGGRRTRHLVPGRTRPGHLRGRLCAGAGGHEYLPALHGRMVGVGIRPTGHPDDRPATAADRRTHPDRRRSGPRLEAVDALRHLHVTVQHHRPAGHLAAAGKLRRPSGRRAVGGRLRPRGPAHRRRITTRGRGPLVRPPRPDPRL
ncbi:uncharacterized protein METZ01_LOCUS77249, partial [marine metagenome]